MAKATRISGYRPQVDVTLTGLRPYEAADQGPCLLSVTGAEGPGGLGGSCRRQAAPPNSRPIIGLQQGLFN